MHKPFIQSPSVLYVTCMLATLSLSATRAPAAPPVTLISATIPPGTVSVSVANEIQAAVARGLDYLAANQSADGSWSTPSFPALTALPVRALSASPVPAHQRAARKGIDYLKSCVQPDGGIYREGTNGKGGLATYNTAISMTVLYECGGKSVVPMVLRAREFVSASQQLGGDIYRGGFGYDKNSGRPYADLLNTFSAAQAMYVTAGAEDSRPTGEKRADIDWDATIKFVERMQVGESSGSTNSGGFFYNPADAKAGTDTAKDDTVVFRAYGSMTYAGMLSLIYAKLPRNDHRVKSAFDWASRHWSLAENPGMGSQGLYFFYDVLSRALTAYGQDLVETSDGKLINWREELAKQLLSTQQIDAATGHGFWINPDGRYWESNPILVTCYALTALQGL